MTLNAATQSQTEEKFLLREKTKESSTDLVAFYIRAQAHTCMPFCLAVYVYIHMWPEANLRYGSSGTVHLVLLSGVSH